MAKVVLTRRIAASPQQVYEACIRPELIAAWFSPKPFDVCEVEADVRVGGTFRFRMTGDPGTYGAMGVYREIVPAEKLQLTWRWVEGPETDPPDGPTSMVTLTFAGDGASTLVTLTHEQLPNQEEADGHEEGWREALDKLEALLRTKR